MAGKREVPQLYLIRFRKMLKIQPAYSVIRKIDVSALAWGCVPQARNAGSVFNLFNQIYYDASPAAKLIL